MPLRPRYKKEFIDLQKSKKFRHLDSQIGDVCGRLCKNPRACHAHQLHGEWQLYWSADIAKKGRGSERIIFQVHCPKTPDIPKDEIWFVTIIDTHL